MDDPIQDITEVVHLLTQSPPKTQQETIDKYFTKDASFTHPFCRTGSFSDSRQLIHYVFRWYKVMSPRIELQVNSVAFDETNLILYVDISQVFAIWLIPTHRADVTLTTVLKLTRGSDRKYYIASQNDLYQTDQFIKFVFPWGGAHLVMLWHFWATFFCAIGAILFTPFTQMMQVVADRKSGEKKVLTNGSSGQLDARNTSARAESGNDAVKQFGGMQVVK